MSDLHARSTTSKAVGLFLISEPFIPKPISYNKGTVKIKADYSVDEIE